MEEWMLLYAAGIAAVATIGVAIWNSRGESAELRQLKAMNEVLAQINDGAPSAKVFADARNGLLVRVATRVAGAPRRRRVIWTSLVVILVVAGLVVALWFWGADLAPMVANVAGGLALGALMAAVVSAVSQMTATWNAKRAQEQARARHREVELMVANWFPKDSEASEPQGE